MLTLILLLEVRGGCTTILSNWNQIRRFQSSGSPHKTQSTKLTMHCMNFVKFQSAGWNQLYRAYAFQVSLKHLLHIPKNMNLTVGRDLDHTEVISASHNVFNITQTSWYQLHEAVHCDCLTRVSTPPFCLSQQPFDYC